MPAPKAFLRQQHQFNLDPKKAYTKSDIGSDGHIKNRVAAPVAPVKKEDLKPMPKETAPKAKPTEAVKPASAAPSAPKSDKSVKPAPAKPVAEVKKVEAAKSQATGEKASDESTVEPKEGTDPAPASDVGADASTVKPA